MTYSEYKEEQESCFEMILPEKIFIILERIQNLFNVSFYFKDIEYVNRGGWIYAKAPGFSYSYCTFSMENGPDLDFREEIQQIIKGLGFKLENSFGNNGLDPAESFGRDCYWHYEFAYEPMIEYDL